MCYRPQTNAAQLLLAAKETVRMVGVSSEDQRAEKIPNVIPNKGLSHARYHTRALGRSLLRVVYSCKHSTYSTLSQSGRLRVHKLYFYVTRSYCISTKGEVKKVRQWYISVGGNETKEGILKTQKLVTQGGMSPLKGCLSALCRGHEI